jgi:hypothetical protein
MNIEGKWVHFDDTLELEIFLNICEELGATWSDKEPPRYFLKSNLKTFSKNKLKSKSFFPVGYILDTVVIRGTTNHNLCTVLYSHGDDSRYLYYSDLGHFIEVHEYDMLKL